MKVLHVLNDSIPLIGGYTSRSKYIVSHQKRIGIEPFVVTSVRQGMTRANVERIDGVEYFRTFWSKKNNFLGQIPIIAILAEIALFFKRIRDAIRAVNPDVIHAHSPILCAIPAMFAAKMNRIPIVYEIRAFWEDAAVASGKFTCASIEYRLIRLLETIICRHVNRVVPISCSMKQDLLNRGIPGDKLFVVPNGVDDMTFESKTKDRDLAARLGLDGKTVIGYLGTFYDFEGVEDLIRVFDILHKQEKDLALLLIGGGEKERQIRAQVKRLGNPGVVLMEKVPPNTVPNYYALMDMVVYPRKSTRITEMTTPLKPLEAMALGKPVICSAVGGLKELVGPGNGFFFTPGNDEELIYYCKKLICDPSLSAKLAAAGKKRALKERNWSHIVKAYVSVYQCITKRVRAINKR